MSAGRTTGQWNAAHTELDFKGMSMQRQQGGSHQVAVLQRGAVDQRQVCKPCCGSLHADVRHTLAVRCKK